ncbi:uncharacterized protein LOC112348646 isoform X1 [Selaginella moellendorffii]|uniref:uncharacterized protein LOC112348646 isoform X1 n=1 Tax=Selaginella moellendorffii TaxID=88036 RepID=UPI000D1CD908|nr:uncharacterized protein LOC112348646 isoform X1 [Selaginella moellendorffii]|eukprot:XP_024537313.1 uncharacterized protein LOC112348646 isoform X1 [Selaginella moellendorffii]
MASPHRHVMPHYVTGRGPSRPSAPWAARMASTLRSAQVITLKNYGGELQASMPPLKSHDLSGGVDCGRGRRRSSEWNISGNNLVVYHMNAFKRTRWRTRKVACKQRAWNGLSVRSSSSINGSIY